MNKTSNESDLPSKSPRESVTTPSMIADADLIAEQYGIDVAGLAAIYRLDSVKFLGPQAFKELHEAGVRPIDVFKDPKRFPIKGKRGDKIRTQIESEAGNESTVYRDRAVRQLLAAKKHQAHILTYKHPHYPPNVYRSNYPSPVLYVRGSLEVLRELRTVACVGSRNIRPPYTVWETKFARIACSKGLAIISGFALGADSIGHRTAWDCQGKTVCVMPGGLDRPFPPENRQLWNNLLDYSGAAFVSESPFGISASSLTLRKRNKLIVAFSSGVLVAQSSVKGGAMNAYRFAIESHKPVATFEADAAEDTSGNRSIPEYSNAVVLKSSDEAYEQWLQGLSSLI